MLLNNFICKFSVGFVSSVFLFFYYYLWLMVEAKLSQKEMYWKETVATSTAAYRQNDTLVIYRHCNQTLLAELFCRIPCRFRHVTQQHPHMLMCVVDSCLKPDLQLLQTAIQTVEHCISSHSAVERNLCTFKICASIFGVSSVMSNVKVMMNL